jgi:hypothetical protein
MPYTSSISTYAHIRPAELIFLRSAKIDSLTMLAEPRSASFVIAQLKDMHTPALRCLRIIFPKMPPFSFQHGARWNGRGTSGFMDAVSCFNTLPARQDS